MKAIKIIILTFFLFFVTYCASSFAGEKLLPDESPDMKTKKAAKASSVTENIFTPDFSNHLDKHKNNDAFKLNPESSYDANFKYKMNFNVYDRKLKLVPKIRITKKIEEKIKPSNLTAVKEKNSLKKIEIIPEQNQNKNLTNTSSQTNSIFVGMDLSYALKKDLFIDSNFSFYKTALKINNKDIESRLEKNAYKYEGNAMSLSIGLRKQLTNSISAGLIYNWRKWFNETEEFKDSKPEEEMKDLQQSQDIVNLVLRYDF